jgi:hypothetical protein
MARDAESKQLGLFSVSHQGLVKQYWPYNMPRGHDPILIIPLPNIVDSFLVVTTNSIMYFDTSSTEHELSPSAFNSLFFPLNETNQDILISCYTLDIDSEASTETQHLYLASERGDIFHGSITSYPPTVSFSHIGNFGHNIERIALLKEDTASYLVAFGSHGHGPILMVPF